MQRGYQNKVLKGCTGLLPTFTCTRAQRNQHDHEDTDHKGGIHPYFTRVKTGPTLTSIERQMLTTTEMRCLRKAAGKTRMDKIRNEEIRRRVNMQPAEQTTNKNKMTWWSHSKRMAPTAPQSNALVIQPEGRRPREGHETAGKKMYRELQ